MGDFQQNVHKQENNEVPSSARRVHSCEAGCCHPPPPLPPLDAKIDDSVIEQVSSGRF